MRDDDRNISSLHKADLPRATTPFSGEVTPNVDQGGEQRKSISLQIPAINLPKGGGALKSIDEKFRVNSSNGTAAFDLALPLSQSRSELSPALQLQYSSGGGNSAFGLGWSISLPSIRRRTDKRLPRYRDSEESDIFQVSGAEDMVPKWVQDVHGNWAPDVQTPAGYQIKRYRPRIEGAFALIEQVNSAKATYWKVTAKDNTVSFYGLTAQARIADPADPSRIFEWLPEIIYDDKGNCIQYSYTAEDLSNVPNLLHERNRLNGNQRFANTYLKQVAYCNKAPYSPTPKGGVLDPYNPAIPNGQDYLFFLVLDYGEHDLQTPLMTPSVAWPCRLDPFSNGKPGFDCRTYRLCRRFLHFHQFAELDAQPVLVKSLDLKYQYFDFKQAANPYNLTLAEADFIVGVTETGWVGTAGTGYKTATYPPMGFDYELPVWNTSVDTIASGDRENIPQGLTSPYQFTDLYNEGIAGVLSEQSTGWYYNHNLGDGVFEPARLVATKPSFTGLSDGALQLEELAGDGRKFIVSTEPPNRGYFELRTPGTWQPFMAFQQFPTIDLQDPNVKRIDLNGDGMVEIVVSQDNVFTWYPSAGTLGYDSPEMSPRPFDEEKGPAIVFADPVESIFFADMTGDGLTDLVRIRNGEISYWPNLGWGIFGAKVNMSDAPLFDTIDQFNPTYLRLADINGTGATDVLYLGKEKWRAWLNAGGNAWGDPFEVPAFPDTPSPNQLSVTDFLGNGTACIVWSSPLPNEADEPIRYIDLMGGHKPYLLNSYTNGMGKTVNLQYKSSTWYYLQDKKAGTPWLTRLSFPVHCVASVQTTDAVSGTSYSNSYSYHHGYYDHTEKEYRGFARVDTTDTDQFATDAMADQAPVLTKTWYHVGARYGLDRLLEKLAIEYFQNPAMQEYRLPGPTFPADMNAQEQVEAERACKGMILRQELYALDPIQNPGLQGLPYLVTEHSNVITLLQPLGPNPYSVFLSLESENISYHYERNPADPRITHTLNTAYDIYGNVTDSYAVAYPRSAAAAAAVTLPGGQPLFPAMNTEQQKTYIIYTQYAYTKELITAATYRLPVACETIRWQWTGGNPSSGTPAAPPGPPGPPGGGGAAIPQGFFLSSDFTHPTVPPALSKLSQQRTLFLQDDLLTVMPLGTMDPLGLAYQQYYLAIDASVTALNGKATPALFQGGKYLLSDDAKAAGYFPVADANGEWWIPAGHINYLNAGAPLPFFRPYQYLDAYGYPTTIGYDGYWLLLTSVTDFLNNKTTGAPMNYRVLLPETITDANKNATDFRYDRLGHVAAIALRGKGEGDAIQPGFTADLTPAELDSFFTDPITNGPALLQGASSRFVYRFPSAGNPASPFSAGSIARTRHLNQLPETWDSEAPVTFQYLFEYTDGLGRPAMKKVQADADTGMPTATSCDGNGPPKSRWIGSGKVVYNNKGNPVMQYEPYFSTSPAYEEAPANGVTPVLYYDPLGRLTETDFPDGTTSRIEFDPWTRIDFDRNDNTAGSPWYLLNATSPDPYEVNAAAKALAHKGTPTVHHLDPFGRSFFSVGFNIVNGVNTFYPTYTQLDIKGNPVQVTDARNNPVMQFDYDLVDRVVHRFSMDAGDRWMLPDTMDKLIDQWEVNGGHQFLFSYQYDSLHRPLKSYVQIDGGPLLLYNYAIYGEYIQIGGAADTDNNLRGKIYRQFDDSGLVTHYHYDFKGNLVQSGRTFTTNYKSADGISPVNQWTGVTANDLANLEKDIITQQYLEYVAITHYDALNRPLIMVRPFLPPIALAGSVIPSLLTAANISNADVVVPSYGDSGLLNLVDVFYGGSNTPTAYVNRICHNEKGQRLCIQYGNQSVTRYSYDIKTFRLSRLLTTSNTGQTIVQDLSYYYDPVGNITHVADQSQPTAYYKNQAVSADGDYTYDAVYQLIAALGREHIGQNTLNETAGNSNYRDFPFAVFNPVPAPTDALAMRGYQQKYGYDAAGNMTSLQHIAAGGSYTRTLTYKNTNNQLATTQIGAGPVISYHFDTHGNMIDLPQLPVMGWNFKDELVATSQQLVANGGKGQTTFYNYDASGMRTRKVTEGPAAPGGVASRVAERLYIANFEIYRTFDNTGAVSLQRETLHVMDDKTRIATIDRKTIDAAGADATVLNSYYPRFQLGNHLDSCLFELDMQAQLISSEEFHPFGTTSYHAGNAILDVPEKRYRYTGKERDEESGLYYHGARYYAPWLCRWTAADPQWTKDGFNLYRYVSNRPTVLLDRLGSQGETPNERAAILEKLTKDYKAEKVVGGLPGATPEQLENIGKALDSFTVKQLNQLVNAGVHFTGIYLSAKDRALEKNFTNKDRPLIIEKAAGEYRPGSKAIQLKGGNSPGQVKHELAHALDHLRGGGKYTFASDKELKKSFESYQPGIDMEHSTIEQKRKYAFDYTNESAESLWNEREFYAEGYAVYSYGPGGADESQAKLLARAPGLYNVLEKQFIAEGLITKEQAAEKRSTVVAKAQELKLIPPPPPPKEPK